MNGLFRSLPGGIAAAVMIAASASVGAADTQITIPLRCGGLGYDSSNGALYATARANTGAFSNCLLRIEPFSGGLAVVTNLDAEPGTLTLSSEHRALYFALPGQGVVRRFDLSTGKLGVAF